MSRLTARQQAVLDARCIKAMGDGAQTWVIADRLKRSGFRQETTQVYRRMKRLAREGRVRRDAEWDITNSCFWRPVV